MHIGYTWALPLSLLLSVPAGAEPPPRLSAGPHLFIDDYLIEQSTNLTRTTHQPEKLPLPVLAKGGPAHQRAWMWLKVLHDPAQPLFRIWYNVGTSIGSAYAYAESRDGIAWERPNLGIVDVGGSTDNNLFKTGGFGHGLAVDEGPDSPDPARRYRAMLFGSVVDGRVTSHDPGNPRSGLCVTFSPDGIHWTDYEGNPVLPYYPEDSPDFRRAAGDCSEIISDPLKERYLLILKMYAVPEDGYPGKTQYASAGQRRLVGQSESRDFTHWTEPRRIIVPDKNEPGLEEYYCMHPMIRGDQYIGFLRLLRDDLPADEGGPVQGIGWTELCTSRDGENWERHREPFLDRNPQPGTWDHAMAWLGDCVRVGDEEFIYYGGYSAGHKVGDRQIGLAKLRKNGFVSRDAGSKRGYLHTPLVTLDAAGMTVNAKVDGELRVRVLDETGEPIEGLDWMDCARIEGDSLAHEAKWAKPLGALRGKPVWLEFGLVKAELYGFDLLEG